MRKPSLLAREDVIGGLGNSHHHVRRLDDGVDLVADLEPEIVDSLIGDEAVTMVPLTSMRTCAVVAPFLMSMILPAARCGRRFSWAILREFASDAGWQVLSLLTSATMKVGRTCPANFRSLDRAELKWRRHP